MLAGLLALAAGPARAQTGLRLMMVRRRGCVYCAQWDREIGPGYARHPDGRAAPLFMVDADGPYPDGLALARMPWLTPSFILLRDGIEMARFEGYPGAAKFYPVLHGMLGQARAPG